VQIALHVRALAFQIPSELVQDFPPQPLLNLPSVQALRSISDCKNERQRQQHANSFVLSFLRATLLFSNFCAAKSHKSHVLSYLMGGVLFF
jgi:hypothetical protein